MSLPASRAAASRRPYSFGNGRVLNLGKYAVLGLLLSHLPVTALAAPEQWASTIDAFAAADAASPPTRGGVLFVGSSSIRLWKTLAEDFPSLPVTNRGFGGSELADSVYYFDQLVRPHAPKIVVLYAGENDLVTGATPEAVADSFRSFCEKLHASLPATRVIFVSIKPSPKRWHFQAEIARANALIKAQCERDAWCTFVDVYSPMLDERGVLRPELFAEDGIHMSRDGYRLWTWLLAPPLAASSRTIATR